MNKKMVVLALVSLPGFVMSAELLTGCAGEADDRLRLACYDNAYKRQKTGSEVVSDAQVATSDSHRDASIMSKTWELGPTDKRDTFIVRTYLPNFLLPFHYTSNINRTPHSPTQQAGSANRDYRSIEAKLQISLRAKIVEDLLLPGADLWAAYTQRSLWQLWDAGDSSPFRSTDYQPEMIYVVPVTDTFGKLPLGWKLRMLQLGFAHQSNGQSDPLSRSWNRLTMGAGFERGDFTLQIRGNQRISLQGKDDNPDLADYIGRGEVNMAWLPGTSTLGLTWRTNFKSASRGSLQLDWTYPVAAEAESNQTREALRAANERILDLERDLAGERARTESLEQQIESARNQQTTQEVALADARKDYSAELEKYRLELRRTEERLEASEKRALLEIDHERQMTVKAQRELLQLRNSSLENEELLRNELAYSKAELANVRQMLGVAEGKQDELRAGNEKHLKELAVLRLTLGQQETQLALLQREVELAQAAAKQLQGSIASKPAAPKVPRRNRKIQV